VFVKHVGFIRVGNARIRSGKDRLMPGKIGKGFLFIVIGNTVSILNICFLTEC
jgi:TM2 domain-containing membrane protein YozV